MPAQRNNSLVAGKERIGALAKNEQFIIPAGNPRYQVNAARTFDEDITIYLMATHMHQLGKDTLVEAELPNSAKKCLVEPTSTCR